MTGPPFRFDEVGDRSVLELDIIGKYRGAYAKTFNVKGRQLKKY